MCSPICLSPPNITPICGEVRSSSCLAEASSYLLEEKVVEALSSNPSPQKEREREGGIEREGGREGGREREREEDGERDRYILQQHQAIASP
jgi:hypothetical protein